VDHLIGRKLSQKYRFAEGADYQRRALKLDPAYLPAKVQLCQDLLRLGDEQRGWKLAAEVYEADGYNVLAHNLVNLKERLDQFRTLEADGFVVRMEAREAAIYGTRVVNLLQRARQILCEKYDLQIEQPVVVEIFPRQEDFAIRTFGMPGGAGFLGVCFGRVITANSPASQGEHPSNWQSVLWHEFCHVVTLQKTRNKMPRWLSEGISVYEERQQNQTWGQVLTPRYRAMILGDELTPVSRLSGAFLQPKSPLHLQFAYYESSLVVEYLVETYGLDAVRRLLDDLATGLEINDALERHAGGLKQLDAKFAEFARQRAQALAPQIDWETKPELKADATAADWAEWNKKHPDTYAGLMAWARRLMVDKEWAAARVPLDRLVALYPGDNTPGNALQLLSQVHRQMKNVADERRVLLQLADLDGAAFSALLRLAELATLAQQWDQVQQFAEMAMAVNPLLAPPHRYLVAAAEKLEHDQVAIDASRALLQLDPVDPAQLYFRLARLLNKSGERSAAKHAVLQCLEVAPRYRAALQLLLELTELKPDSDAPTDVQQKPAPSSRERS
jgi:tetratricopeptide (TPR) repeat protein